MQENLTLNEMIKKLMENFSGTEILPESYITEKQKQDSQIYDGTRSSFLKGLDSQKQDDFDFLESMTNTIASTDVDAAILLGMQLKAAIDEIIRDPIRYLNEKERDETYDEE